MNTILEVSNFLKAIADPTRLGIIDLLNHYKNPLCVNAIAKKLKITQSAVSQHLRILRQLGLVEGQREGYHIHYRVDSLKLKSYIEGFSQLVDPSNLQQEEDFIDCKKNNPAK
jgi:DNA-binding transcriptional ArsR family regulator